MEGLNRAMGDQPTNQPTVWQLVISHSYDDAKKINEYLSKKCDRFLCSEHEADDEINRTHVHYMLVNYKHTKVSLTKEINKYWQGSDNFGILTARPGTGDVYDETLLAQYISKGREDAFYVRGYSSGFQLERLCDFVKNYSRDRETFKTQRVYQNGVSQDGTNRGGVSAKIQYKLKVESPAQQKLRKNDHIKMIIKRMREFANEKGYPSIEYISTPDVRDIIRKQITEWEDVVGIYTAIDYYDTVMMRTNPGVWNTMFDNILEKRKCRT